MEGSRLAHFQQETAGTYHEYYLHQGRGVCHGFLVASAVDLQPSTFCRNFRICRGEALKYIMTVTPSLPGQDFQKTNNRSLVGRSINLDLALQECIDVFHG